MIDHMSVFFCQAVKRFFTLLLALSTSIPAYAVVATATVTANITSTITVGTINGLIFGDLSSGLVAGTIALSPAGVRTTTGGVTVNTAIAGSPAAFDVQGDPNATYSISFPVSVTMIDAALNSMVVDNFASYK